MYLAENIRKYRLEKGLTQEDVAEYLHVTAQSVSKWERNESYPDITLLPALANIFATSIDLLVGMDMIRAAETKRAVHARATEYLRNGDVRAAENIYRDALLLYPNKPGMMLGLAGVLAMSGEITEAIRLTEKGLSLSENVKQKATMRAVLCFLYEKAGLHDDALRLASELPHERECRETIQPLVENGLAPSELDAHIKKLLLG